VLRSRHLFEPPSLQALLDDLRVDPIHLIVKDLFVLRELLLGNFLKGLDYFFLGDTDVH
jgi:hypothetical protein